MVQETMPDLPVQGGAPSVDIDANESTGAYKPTHRLVGMQTPPQPVRAMLYRYCGSREKRLRPLEHRLSCWIMLLKPLCKPVLL
eukprot:6491137-Amphidinium_carterae.1